MKENVFISGPISGYDREERRKAFAAAEKGVYEHWLDAVVVNPMTLEEPLDPTWEGYLRRDSQILRLCEGMYVLNGWQESKGSFFELEYAIKMGMPRIVLENPWSIYVMKKNGKILSEKEAREYFEDLKCIIPEDMNSYIRKYKTFVYYIPSIDSYKEGTIIEVTFHLAALQLGLIGRI